MIIAARQTGFVDSVQQELLRKLKYVDMIAYQFFSLHRKSLKIKDFICSHELVGIQPSWLNIII